MQFPRINTTFLLAIGIILLSVPWYVFKSHTSFYIALDPFAFLLPCAVAIVALGIIGRIIKKGDNLKVR